MPDYDVIVAGGGPVGALCCLALRHEGVSVLQLRGETPASERPIALSFGSRQLIEQCGAWPEATPIEAIHVSQQGGFGRTLMRASDYGLPALGYVASYTSVLAALRAAGDAQDGRVTGWESDAEQVRVTIESARAQRSAGARLLVIADGGETIAPTTQRDYRQIAVVAEIEADKPHANLAWERFTASGPIALLPHRDRHALIWSTTPDAAESLLGATEAQFVSRLREAFGARAGTLLHAGPRTGFPLSLRVRDPAPEPRVVLIGNAAQTLHPVAGQGMNLGLRDAWELAELVARTDRGEIGDAAFLRRYTRTRRLDRRAGIGLTDALVRAFSNNNPLSAALRGAALAWLDIAPPARHFLARRMIYGARALP